MGVSLVKEESIYSLIIEGESIEWSLIKDESMVASVNKG